MDPLTHSLVGALAAKTAKTSKKRFWIMFFLGSAPDLDIFANSLGSWAFIFQHRGITHSIVGLFLQTFLYAWALGRWDKGPFKERAFHYFFPLFFHILADYLTCYGVPLFSPFSFKGYSADLAYSVSVVPIVIMIFGLLWLARNERHGWKETRLIWASWVFYLALTLSGKAYATKLTDHHESPSLSMIPSIANPFSWHGIYADENAHLYQSYSIDLLHGKSAAQKVFAMPNGDFPVHASLKSEEVQAFLRDNRWPVVRVSRQGDNTLVEWGNVLFSSRGIVRGKVAVEVSPTGDIISQKKLVTFWDPA